MATNNLIISCDLQKPEKNYAAVIVEIRKLGEWTKIHFLLWYVKSRYSAADAEKKVRWAMEEHDSIIVIDATNNTASWSNLDDNVAAFIREKWTK